MAALPPITQLSGNHGAIMEGYWSMLDPKNTGKVDAGSAAAFLKKSQLREPILHKIWNMSDPEGKGYLDKQGLFMALRLIAACQAGKDPLVKNMALSDPPPKFMGVEVPVVPLANKWTIDDAEKAKNEQLFQTLQPSKGLLDGNKARPFMMQSQLPRDTLGKIWGLSDIDRDGNLDLDEFCVAVKLMSLAKSGEVLPATLPSSLLPPSKATTTTTTAASSGPGKVGGSSTPPSAPAASSTAGGILPLPASLTPTPSDSSPSHGSPVPPKKMNATPLSVGGAGLDVEWVVSAELKSKYDGYFQGIDKDHDGYVSGEEARSLFMASNLQQAILAHIWNLCDIEKNGKLNAEQFALAMYLIAEKVRKKDIPKELTPAMIPPSLRSKVPPSLVASSSSSSSSSAPPTSSSTTTTMAASYGGLTSGLDGGGRGGTMVTMATTVVTKSTSSSFAPPSGGGAGGFGFGSDFSAIQELDSISNEVEAIRKEKLELAEDIKVKQELIQQRKAELEGVQEDVDQATRQREALEREKEEARNLLEQLNSEKAKFEGEIAELKQKCSDEKEEIERLKVQLSEQESSNKTQTEELTKLQEQLEQLRKEEQEYKQKVEMGKAELTKLQKASSNLNSEITQVQQRIEGLKEEHQSLTTALTLYAPTGSASGPSHSSGVVNINDVGKLSAELHVPHMAEHDAISARATAGSSSPVSSLSGFSTNSHLDEGTEEGGGGAKDDKTHPDPFSSTGSSMRDPFAAFTLPTTDSSSAFGSSGRSLSGKPSDLSAFDPFGSGGSGSVNFDPFKSTSSGGLSVPATGEELFGSSNDPFSGGGSAHISSSSSANSLPTSTAGSSMAPPPAVDPFSGQDPFNADPFGSTAAASTKDSTQPTSLWGSSTPFDVDPFGQANLQTPTDPFSGADPFGEDPFKSAGGGGNGTSIGSSSGGGGNPFS